MGVLPPPFSTATLFILLSGAYFTASSYIKAYFKQGGIEPPSPGGDDESSFEEDIESFFGGVPNALTFSVLIMDVLAVVIAATWYLGFCDRHEPPKPEITVTPPEDSKSSGGQKLERQDSLFKRMGSLCSGSSSGSSAKPLPSADDYLPDKDKPTPVTGFGVHAPPKLPSGPRLGGSFASPKPKPAVEGDHSDSL
mmetsp:Transcript_129312/g.241847  ORF Transcript_129312/g.241847 Transcript_129312/m.241847 type:complete len:195 (+) Transcript_129312:60-644(+)